MKRIGLLLLVAIFQPGFVACARDHGRVKKTPTPVAAEPLASDMVMNDSNIVSTDRGLYRSRRARRPYQRLCPRSQSGLAEIPVALFKTFSGTKPMGTSQTRQRLLVWE